MADFSFEPNLLFESVEGMLVSARSFFQDPTFLPFRLDVVAGMMFGDVVEEAEGRFQMEKAGSYFVHPCRPSCHSHDPVGKPIASAGVQGRSPLAGWQFVMWSRSCVGSETDSTSRARVLKERFAQIVPAEVEDLVSD